MGWYHQRKPKKGPMIFLIYELNVFYIASIYKALDRFIITVMTSCLSLLLRLLISAIMSKTWKPIKIVSMVN